MNISFMAGETSPLAKNYGRDILKLVSQLDRQENDLFKATTGLDIYGNYRSTVAERVRGNYFLALDDDGNLMGVVFVKVLKNEYREPTLQLGDVVVAPRFRGKGVASALLDRAIKYARDTACLSITLSVMINNHAALSLYQKYGFVTSSMQQVKTL